MKSRLPILLVTCHIESRGLDFIRQEDFWEPVASTAHGVCGICNNVQKFCIRRVTGSQSIASLFKSTVPFAQLGKRFNLFAPSKYNCNFANVPFEYRVCNIVSVGWILLEECGIYELEDA